eukprot:12712028-Alexandrium_andersonii.AAC.1
MRQTWGKAGSFRLKGCQAGEGRLSICTSQVFQPVPDSETGTVQHKGWHKGGGKDEDGSCTCCAMDHTDHAN